MDDVLAWLGAVGGVLGGGAGLTFGILALKQSKASNKLAEDARDIAQRGEQLGTEANGLARESNSIAVDARQLAEEANTISKRGELRETERHDVHWEGDWVAPGRYALTNMGDDEAFDVRAVVTVDGEQAESRANSVPGRGGQLLFELPRAAQELRREIRERRARMRTPDPYGIDHAASLNAHIHTFTERVVWKSALGQQHVHEPKHSLGTLGDLD
ncbi:hypothetical protein ACFTWF_32420 [Rhodococcus sp. NPDC056960]|uniref:hypothetical protein n=1 Tax=Rhodococcus sp. NPDC056960 TaxID=3345982 RepID=UPI00363E354A